MSLTNEETAEASRPPLSRSLVVLAGLAPVLLGVLHGGYFPEAWLTLGIVGPALFLMIRAAGGPNHPWLRTTVPPWAYVAVLCLAVFAAWNVLSGFWATDGAAAVLEGTRSLLYLFALATAMTVARDTRDARLLMSTLVLSSALVGLLTIFGMASSGSPEDYFRFFKLNEPIGYYNAEATFFSVPALMGVHLASRKSTRRLLRPILFAAGVVLLQAGLLTQSRGGFWALTAAVLVYMALVPGRPRALLWWGVALAIVVLTFGRLNAPHIDLREGDLEALVHSARAAAAAVSAGLVGALAASGALVWIDGRLAGGRRTVLIGRAAALTVVLLALVFLFVRFPALRDPVRALDSGWTQFKGSEMAPTDVRILDLSGSHRYELWQVAWRTFQESPLTGVGADNYVVAWNRLRPIPHDVRQPHNVYLRLLAELGLPGLALFLGAVGISIASGLRRSSKHSPHDRALAACAAAACAVFLVHAAAEWVWHVPAVGLTFFLLLGLLLGNGSEDSRPVDLEPPSDDDHPPRRAARVSPLSLTAAIGLCVAVLSVPQLFSIRFDDRATSLLAQGEPALARQAAVWASRANPLAGSPHVIIAKAASAEGDLAAAEAAFSEATRKNPADWHTFVLWGDVRAEAGGDPLPLYRQAGDINPLAHDVLDRLERAGL